VVFVSFVAPGRQRHRGLTKQQRISVPIAFLTWQRESGTNHSLREASVFVASALERVWRLADAAADGGDVRQHRIDASFKCPELLIERRNLTGKPKRCRPIIELIRDLDVA